MQKLPVTERFLQSFKDPAIFDCGPFNLLKVVQDALIREVGNNNQRVRSTLFNLPPWAIRLYFKLKKRGIGQNSTSFLKPELLQRKQLVVMPTRFATNENGDQELMYYGRLGEVIDRNKILLMYVQPTKQPPVKADVTRSEIGTAFASLPPDDAERQMISDLKKCYRNITAKSKLSPTELKHVKVGLDEFWRSYRIMNLFLRKTAVKKALLIPGYYTEYLIAALKTNHVEVTEVQHGVITPASHFYIYPPHIKPVVSRALFADKIWLFGAFWKEQLLQGCEFERDQMEIIGEYYVRTQLPPQNLQALDAFCKQYQHLVLVGTQTRRHHQFAPFIQQLADHYSRENPNAAIIIKPHPAEDPKCYSDFLECRNVLITDASLDYLYSRCTAYVSMYSNSLFEATRYPGLRRFVLCMDETEELAQGMANTGIATLVRTGDDPLSFSNHTSTEKSPSADYYFQHNLNAAILRSFMEE